MNICAVKKCLRAKNRGVSMIEAVICMLVICLILFGLLQVFYVAAAQMITDYSAFRAARSETVGFNEEIVGREGRLKAIAASGKMRFPVDMSNAGGGNADYPYSSAVGQFYYERLAIIDYMESRRMIKYEYWNPEYNTNKDHETSFSVHSTSQGDVFTERAVFKDYPWVMPMRGAFVTDGVLDIEGVSKLSKHSAHYLE